MKKFSILLTVLLVLALSFGLLACNGNPVDTAPTDETPTDETPTDETPAGLTAAEQLVIAKQTFAGISNALQSFNSPSMATRPMRYTTDDLDYLFEKYEYSPHFTNDEMFETFHLFVYPIEALLDAKGEDALTYIFDDIGYAFFNGEKPNAIEYVLPAGINFHGVKEVDGYFKTYATVSSVLKINGKPIRYCLVSYYKSDEDFGFELFNYQISTDDDIKVAAYSCVDKKNNTTVMLALPNLTSDYTVAKNGNVILKPLSTDDAALIKTLISQAYGEVAVTVPEIEKQNNGGTVKTKVHDEKLVLNLDVQKLANVA